MGKGASLLFMSASGTKRTSAPVVPVATSACFGFNLVTNAQKVVSSIFRKTWREDREQRARIGTNRDAGLTGKPRLTQTGSRCGHRRKRMMSRCQSQAMVSQEHFASNNLWVPVKPRRIPAVHRLADLADETGLDRGNGARHADHPQMGKTLIARVE
jgi:hypothetical protein